jgi:hypothetical protein
MLTDTGEKEEYRHGDDPPVTPPDEEAAIDLGERTLLVSFRLSWHSEQTLTDNKDVTYPGQNRTDDREHERIPILKIVKECNRIVRSGVRSEHAVNI